jgi:hypothetical protein
MKAYPTTYRNYDESIDHDCTGMDLRDYFAIKIVQAMITNPKIEKWHPDEKSIVKDAYIVADYMMEARNG